MLNVQASILSDVPAMGRYLFFSLPMGCEPAFALRTLADNLDTEKNVVGIGLSTVKNFGVTIAGLKTFPSSAEASIELPSTPMALWCWLKGDDRGELIYRTREITAMLSSAFILEAVVDSFMYADSRDLSGYVDGTENPTGDEAISAAVVNDGSALDGSSFVAVQQWVHDLDILSSYAQDEQDNMIGRRKSDNEELEDAPVSAHIKRTAQESFNPEAFVLRRSMPWANDSAEGLMFVAFGKSFDAFEALLNRMTGAEDGIPDALFNFTQPVNGSYYWCPPTRDNKLNLSAIGV